MPILQLQRRVLPNVPGPSLSRERAPRPDFSGLEAGISRLGASASQMTEMRLPESGLASVAQGIGRVAQVLQLRQEKRQAAEDDIAVANAEGMLLESWTAHQRAQAENPQDPAAWEKDWEERFEAASGQVAGLKVSDDAAQRIKLLTMGFGGKRRADVAEAATKRTFSLAADAAKGRALRLMNSGDYDGATAAIAEARDKAYISEEESAHWEEQAEKQREADQRKAAREAAAAEIDADPWAASQRLKPENFPGLDPGEVRTLQAAAEREMEDRQREMFSSLTDAVVAGTVDDAGIDSFAAQARLGAAAVAKLKSDRAELARLKQSREPLNTKLFQETNEAMRDYDPAKDPTGEKWAALHRQAQMVALTGGEQGGKLASGLSAYFWNKNPAGPNKKESDNDVGQEYTRLLNETLAADEDAGVWGPLRSGPKPEKKEDEESKAYEARLAAWEEARKTAAENAKKAAAARFTISRDLKAELQRQPEMGPEGFRTWYQKQTGRQAVAAQVSTWSGGATGEPMLPMEPGAPDDTNVLLDAILNAKK